MRWKTYRFGDFLTRSKRPIDIEDQTTYKRVTIKTKHQGVSVRDAEIGKKIGTKKQFILKSGQFVLSKIDARFGAFGIAPDEVDGSIITGNFWAYDVDFSKINIEWFNQFTNSKDFYDVCEKASSGITHRKYLDEKFFLNYALQLPSVEEQYQIIERFKKNKSKIETLSSELTHQLSLVKQLRQAFLREAMQGKLVAQDPQDEPAAQLLAKIKAEKERLIGEKKTKKEKELPPIGAEEVPFEVPEGWVWCRLGEAANMVFDGPFGSHLKTADYTSFGVQVIRLENLGQMKFIHEKETFVSFEKYGTIKSHEVFEGDVIIGSFLADGVRCIILPKLQGKAIAKADCFTIRLDEELFSRKYLMYLLNSDLMYKELSALLRGMTRLRINTTQLKNLPIPLPPLAEQHRIVAKLDELMRYCDALEASIQASREQNEGLLQQVLREALEPGNEE